MTDTPQLITTLARPTAVIPGVVPVAELAGFFDASFSRLPAVLAEQQARIVGPAFARYRGRPAEEVDLEVGFPVDREIAAAGDVVPGTLPAGRVAQLVHAGSFDGLTAAWQALGEWIGSRGLRTKDGFWEVYLTEPSPDMDPADLRTELNWPIAD